MDQLSGGQGAFHFSCSALGPELRSLQLTSVLYSVFSSMLRFIDCDVINGSDLAPFFLIISQSQQKCIANFALLCCLAVLVALIFSSVNIWGDVEDDVTEENCGRDCR